MESWLERDHFKHVTAKQTQNSMFVMCKPMDDIATGIFMRSFEKFFS
jgi:hypothetical protein